MRTPAADALLSLFSCRAGGLRLVQRRPRLPDLCTAISTITTFSSLALRRIRPHRDPQARRRNRSRSYITLFSQRPLVREAFVLLPHETAPLRMLTLISGTGDCGSTNLEPSNTRTANAADMQC